MSTCDCNFLELRYPIERNTRVYFNDGMNLETGIQNHDYYIDNKKMERVNEETRYNVLLIEKQ